MKPEKLFHLLLEVFWPTRRCNERNHEITHLYKDHEASTVKIEKFGSHLFDVNVSKEIKKKLLDKREKELTSYVLGNEEDDE